MNPEFLEDQNYQENILENQIEDVINEVYEQSLRHTKGEFKNELKAINIFFIFLNNVLKNKESKINHKTKLYDFIEYLKTTIEELKKQKEVLELESMVGLRSIQNTKPQIESLIRNIENYELLLNMLDNDFRNKKLILEDVQEILIQRKKYIEKFL